MESNGLQSTKDDTTNPTPNLDMSDFEEDIEAELIEFMLTSRLGLIQEAQRLVELVLWPHLDIFPVFAEVAYFIILHPQPQRVYRLLKWITNAQPFDESRESNFVQYIKDICEYILDHSSHLTQHSQGSIVEPELQEILQNKSFLVEPCQAFRTKLKLILLIQIHGWSEKTASESGKIIHDCLIDNHQDDAAEVLLMIIFFIPFNRFDLDRYDNILKTSQALFREIVTKLHNDDQETRADNQPAIVPPDEIGSARMLAWVQVAVAFINLDLHEGASIYESSQAKISRTTSKWLTDTFDSMGSEDLVTRAIGMSQSLFEELPDTTPRGMCFETLTGHSKWLRTVPKLRKPENNSKMAEAKSKLIELPTDNIYFHHLTWLKVLLQPGEVGRLVKDMPTAESWAEDPSKISQAFDNAYRRISGQLELDDAAILNTSKHKLYDHFSNLSLKIPTDRISTVRLMHSVQHINYLLHRIQYDMPNVPRIYEEIEEAANAIIRLTPLHLYVQESGGVQRPTRDPWPGLAVDLASLTLLFVVVVSFFPDTTYLSTVTTNWFVSLVSVCATIILSMVYDIVRARRAHNVQVEDVR